MGSSFAGPVEPMGTISHLNRATRGRLLRDTGQRGGLCSGGSHGGPSPGELGGGGRVRGRHRPSLQDGHPRRFLKAELFFARRCLLHTCYFVGKASSISHPVNEATAVAAPPAASVEENVSSQRFPCPALESRVPPLPSAARAEASLLAAEQVHKNDLIYYRRHVLKQLTKLQDVKRQASAFSFLNPYRLLAMIKIVFSFLKLELIFLSKAIM